MSAATGEIGVVQDEILAALRAGARTIRTIAEQTGRQEGTVRGAVPRLVRRGLVIRDRRHYPHILRLAPPRVTPTAGVRRVAR